MPNVRPVHLAFLCNSHHGVAGIFHLFFSLPILLILLISLSGNSYANPDRSAQATDKSGFSDFTTAARPSRWAKGRLLVIPRAGLSGKEFNKAIRPHGVRSKHKLKGLNAHIYELPDGIDEVKMMYQLRKDRRFKAIELDRLIELAQIVTDPAFNNSWALPKIQAPTA